MIISTLLFILDYSYVNVGYVFFLTKEVSALMKLVLDKYYYLLYCKRDYN